MDEVTAQHFYLRNVQSNMVTLQSKILDYVTGTQFSLLMTMYKEMKEMHYVTQINPDYLFLTTDNRKMYLLRSSDMKINF
jgi:hypothetical protein